MYTIGGSEIGAVCGVDTFTTPLTLYLRKLGVLPSKAAATHMSAGVHLEPGILSMYAEVTGREVYTARDLGAAHDVAQGKPGTPSDGAVRAYELMCERATVQRVRRDGSLTFRSNDYPWMTATVDAVGYAHDRWGIVDAKNLNERRLAEWDREAPQNYALQLDHYLAVFGETFDWSSIAAMFGGQDLRTMDFGRDEERCDYTKRMSRQFVDEHLAVKVPPHDVRPEDAHLFRVLYPYEQNEDTWEAWPVTVTVGEKEFSAPQFDEMFVRARDERKRWQAEYDNLRFVVLREMGEATRIGMVGGPTYARDAAGKVRRKIRK